MKSSSRRGPLEGVSYDVRELGSLAFLFADARVVRGLYRLSFADGDAYVGQSVDVVSRFASHRRKWDDIVTFEFFPVPEGDLNAPERELIGLTESSVGVRNIRDAHRPGGAGDLEVTIERGVSAILPWAREKRTRPGQSPASPDQKRFFELATMQVYPAFREIVGWYISETIPDPFNTQRHLWSVSCLPSTGKSREQQRLLTVNCGNLESLWVVLFQEDGAWGLEVNINTEPGGDSIDELTDSQERWSVREGKYNLRTVHTWSFELDELIKILVGEVEFPLERLFDQAYALNVALMRGGRSMFGRYHSDALASDLLSASLMGWTGALDDRSKSN